MAYKERIVGKTIDITPLANSFNVDPLPISTLTEKGRKVFDQMKVDIPKWVKCGSLLGEEGEWWVHHMEDQSRFGIPAISQAKDLPQFRRICPVMEIELAVGEDLRRHMSTLTQESTIRTVRQRQRNSEN